MPCSTSATGVPLPDPTYLFNNYLMIKGSQTSPAYDVSDAEGFVVQAVTTMTMTGTIGTLTLEGSLDGESWVALDTRACNQENSTWLWDVSNIEYRAVKMTWTLTSGANQNSALTVKIVKKGLSMTAVEAKAIAIDYKAGTLKI